MCTGRSGRSSRWHRVAAVGLAVILGLGWLLPEARTGGAVRAAGDTGDAIPCRAADLDAAVSHGGVADHLWLAVALTTVAPATTCALAGGLELQVRDADSRLLIAAPIPDTGATTLSAGVGAALTADWDNWCAPDGRPGAHATVAGPLTVALNLPGDDAPLRGHPAGTTAEEGPLDGGPLCLDPAQPSWLVPAALKASPGASFGAPGDRPHEVGAQFLAYWRLHGGLALNGYPISEALDQQLEDGKTYRVQYFERVRLEYHPENQAPYDILLGQFGRRFHPADPPAAPLPDARYFAATGHNLRAGFRAYWEANGGLAQFGYPLTDEITEQLEDGHSYTVQYFERARMVYHPENAPPDDILLGQFGRRVLAGGWKPPESQSPAAGVCPAAGAVATVRVNSDTPLPRCQVVQPAQHLRVVNNTSQPVRARLAQIDVTLPPQGEWTSDQSFGAYLAPGVHVLALSAYPGGGAELWLRP